jgi:Zn-dependent M28 family amino/carboxypeptidase
MHFIMLLAAASTPLLSQSPSPARLRADVRFLSSDLLEGRAPGTRGDRLTTEYLYTQFTQAGLKASFQAVPLVGVSAKPESKLGEFIWLTEFAGQTQQQKPDVQFEGDVVFAGHGIRAPEFQWDDYRGVDVKGKAVVLFTNEPPSSNAKFFGGPALTYYGRWTYKYEEAARRGAAAVLIIHTTQTAGYSWDVVRGSWGREDMQVKLAPGAPALAFAGWITQDAAAKWLGTDVAAMLKEADAKGFRARPLGKRLAGRIVSAIRNVESRNVIAVSPGADAEAAGTAVVFSAHWDHLGMSAAGAGDRIYNGAVDNATGCAILLEMARLWSAMEPKPRRTAIFLATTAEENGLRGAEYYAANPAVPLADTVLNLNFDQFYPFGRVRDFVLDGAERTQLWPQIQHVAERFDITLAPDPKPEQGFYFRSDHFALAKAGVPAFSVKQGQDFVADTEAKRALVAAFLAQSYHQPPDEYSDDWDLSALEQVAKFGFELGLAAANDPRPLTGSGAAGKPMR